MTSIINNESLDGTFMEVFDRSFAPRLGEREEGFRQIFTHLSTNSPVIVETGCLRALGNWSGDGQSTFMFDLFVQKHKGWLMSIDSNDASLTVAKEVISTRTELILGNGAAEIYNLQEADIQVFALDAINLLYLDSFDAFRDVSEIPAPIHYMLELCAAWPMLRSGSIIAIDDYASPGTNGNGIGKGQGVDLFLSLINAEVLHDGYQKVWRLR